jgi:NADH-quinone oxidoreductase subunit L
LVTHAFFKAVLFLGAGSVIIAMHHEQDLRKMGGLKKYMPVTYWTVLLAALANAGIPGLAGFFSKDAIIEATQLSHAPGAGFAYFCIVSGVFVGALYTFRLVFLAFHGRERMDHHTQEHLHESPAVVTLPLVALAIPTVLIGWWIGPILFGGYFGAAIKDSEVMREFAGEFHGPLTMVLHSVQTLPFWLSIAGVAAAWFLYVKRPDLPAVLRDRFSIIYRILDRKYGFDELYSWLFAGGARNIGAGLWRGGDVAVIDGVVVNGSAKLVGAVSGLVRKLQSGFIYHYAFLMIIGVVVFLSAFLAWRHL